MKSKTQRKKAGPAPVRERARSIAPFRVPPVLQGSRLQGFYSQLGYHSVRMAVSDGRVATGGGGSMHQQFNRDQLHNQSREFSRDNGLFQGVIEKGVGFLVGSGFGMQSKSEDQLWRAAAEAWWKVWTEDPEISGIRCWFQVEELVAKELLSQGDTGAVLTDQDKLQLIEAEQIRGKTLKSDGLIRNSKGLVTGFSVCPYTPDGQLDTRNITEIAREFFLFLSRPDRPSAWRAVPPLQAAFAMFHRINDVCDSEALAWQLLARLAFIVNKKDAGLTGLQTSDPDEAKAGDGQPNVTDRVQDWDRGMVFWGEDGEEIKGVERNIPSQNFPESLRMFLRLLGVPIGIPLEYILMDWTKSNYSQSRAVLEQAHQSFVKWQMLLEKRFYQPVWKWVIDMGIRNKVLTNPPADLYALECIKPAYPWIDQLQEAKAYGTQVDRGFITLAQVLKSKNKDIDDVRNARKDEVVRAIEISDEIFEEKKVRVPWQHFAGLEASVNAGMDPAAEADPGAEEDGKAGDGDEEREAARLPKGKPIRIERTILERDDKGFAKRYEEILHYADGSKLTRQAKPKVSA